jgi:hypothetical protein
MSSSYFEDGIVSGLSTSPVVGYMQVRTALGVGRLAGTEISYSNKAMVVDSSDETYDRTDAIFITPSGIEYVAGTPSGSPTAPDHVDGETYYFRIATFTVPAGATDSDSFTGFSYGSPGIDTNIYDYHVERDFHNVLNKGCDLVDIDIDIDSESIDELSIGADSVPVVETKNLYFSVGSESGNLMTGSNVSVYVINDTATFSSPQTNDYIGVGCIIRTASFDYYIYEKISTSQWTVKTSLGESVENQSSIAVTGIYYCYTDLYSAFNGGSPITLVTNYFLRTSKYKINIACYQGQAVEIDDLFIRFFDTDQDNFIRIFTPTDLAKECNAPQSHCANPSGTNFSMQSAGGGTTIDVFTNYTEIDGMLLSAYSSIGIGINNCSGVKLKNNLIYSGECGIVSKDDGHADGARIDYFTDGTVNPNLWGDDISNHWSVDKYKDKYSIHHNSVESVAYEDLLPVATEYDANFDLEFSIIQRSSGYVNVAVCDGASVVAEMVFNQNSIEFNSTTVLRNHKYGTEYKFRIVRGGLIYSDGIFLDVPANYAKVSLYYFYDNKWNHVDDDYSSMSASYNFKIKSSGTHGIGYLKLWGAGDTAPLLDVGSNKNNTIENNIIYSMSSNGIVSSGADSVLNNTVDDCDEYGIYNRNTDVVVNNVGTRCTSGAFLDNENIQYCTSDDATAGSFHKCISSASLEYVDCVSVDALRDYRPAYNSVSIRGNGSSLVSQFNTDATGWTRDRMWDRGALEYIPGIYCFGISSFNGDVKTPCSYEIKTFKHYTIIVFSKDQIDSRLGIGCEVVDEKTPFPLGCVLTKKLSNDKWMVCDYNGTPIATRDGGVVKTIYIKNNYFEDSALDLVGAKKRIVIAYYNDGFLNYDLELLETSTDVDHFVKVTAPHNTDECNQSQRHRGIIGDGSKVSSISIGQCSYTEISNMIINDGVTSLNAGGLFIGYNILKNKGVVLSNFSLENQIFNNLIYECEGFGVSIENILDYAGGIYDARGWSNVTVLNNTVSRCRQAFHFYKSNYKYTATAYVKNNLFQYSTMRDVGCEYRNRRGNFLFKDNMTNKLDFVDKDNGNYYLNEFKDFRAIDRASDKTTFFYDDITGADREPEKWDIGAFENLDIAGIGNLNIGQVVNGYTSAFNGLIPKTTILYLRKVGDNGDPEYNFLTSVDPKVQFNSIEGTDRYAINEFIRKDSLGGVMVDNLIIYTQGGEMFGGTFSLYDRGSRNVVISTYPEEMDFGPSAILYNGPVVDDDSDQEYIHFKNIKIFSEASAAQEFLINDTASTKSIKFTNSIVQVNNNAIAKECAIISINSLFIYRNGSNESVLQLSESDPGSGCHCSNSQIVSYYDGDLSFAVSNSSDFMGWNLTYNFSGGDLSIPAESVGHDLEDTNPQFKYVELTDREFSINSIINKSFECTKSSPVYDAGNNAFVVEDIDIVGNQRIYISGIVDIGPYELMVNNLIIKTSDIESIFQDKFVFVNGYFKTKNKIYKDLEIIGKSEFCRESKVVVVLKESRRDGTYLSDKPNNLMFQYDAHFDLGTRSIVLSKTDMNIGGLLKTIFDDGRYEFYFDDTANLLSVYTNNTYDKGFNLLNNVKFGGSPILS